MYQERIHRTTPKRNPNSHPQFFIRRSEIAFDERLPFVEHVCHVLIESRFGPGCVSPVVIDRSDRPESGAAVFSDLLDDGEMVPFYSLSPMGRAGFQVVEAAYRRAKQMGFVTTKAHGTDLTTDPSSNQGRGSP